MGRSGSSPTDSGYGSPGVTDTGGGTGGGMGTGTGATPPNHSRMGRSNSHNYRGESNDMKSPNQSGQ